jgi:hypothetical protein
MSCMRLAASLQDFRGYFQVIGVVPESLPNRRDLRATATVSAYQRDWMGDNTLMRQSRLYDGTAAESNPTLIAGSASSG